MGHASVSASGSSPCLADLTDKQRQVLNLLIEHKTSKEISRVLGISPHTVDQRIDLAKTKWNLTSRSELAQSYRRLIETPRPTYERMTYEESPVAGPAAVAEEGRRDDTAMEASPEAPDRNQTPVSDATESDYRVVPELFDGRWGTLARLGAILLIAVLIMAAFLAGLSIFVAVSEVYAK